MMIESRFHSKDIAITIFMLIIWRICGSPTRQTRPIFCPSQATPTRSPWATCFTRKESVAWWIVNSATKRQVAGRTGCSSLLYRKEAIRTVRLGRTRVSLSEYLCRRMAGTGRWRSFTKSQPSPHRFGPLVSVLRFYLNCPSRSRLKHFAPSRCCGKSGIAVNCRIPESLRACLKTQNSTNKISIFVCTM